MEVILNTSVKPFNFTFFLRGGLKTVQILPGASRVKAEYIPELRNIKMFSTLEDDGVLAVGVKEPKETMDAREISARVDNKPAKVVDALEMDKPAKTKAPKKSTKGEPKKAKSSTLDLEDL